MALLLHDEFTEVSTTELSLHTPTDAGDGWTQEEQTNVAILEAAAEDRLQPGGTDNDNRIAYSGQPDATEPDVDVQLVIQAISTGATRTIAMFARWVDASNYYSAGTYGTSAANDQEINKKVAGTVTELAAGGSDASGGEEHLFRLRGSALSYRVDDSEVLSSTDSAITAAGKQGSIFGNMWDAGDDVSGAMRCVTFKITEFAAAVVKLAYQPWSQRAPILAQ